MHIPARGWRWGEAGKGQAASEGECVPARGCVCGRRLCGPTITESGTSPPEHVAAPTAVPSRVGVPAARGWPSSAAAAPTALISAAAAAAPHPERPPAAAVGARG